MSDCSHNSNLSYKTDKKKFDDNWDRMFEKNNNKESEEMDNNQKEYGNDETENSG